ncbi:MAG: hypothetical protein AAGD25_07340 [Cyanobacteria bacterium P01_F01_bin.150]
MSTDLIAIARNPITTANKAAFRKRRDLQDITHSAQSAGAIAFFVTSQCCHQIDRPSCDCT